MHILYLACMLGCFSPVQLFATPWTVARQTPLSIQDSASKNTGMGCQALFQDLYLECVPIHMSYISSTQQPNRASGYYAGQCRLKRSLLMLKSLNPACFEQTPGDDEGQGSLACCSPWGRKETDMTQQLNNIKPAFHILPNVLLNNTRL